MIVYRELNGYEKIILAELKQKLVKDLKKFEKESAEKSKKDKYYWEEFRDKERIRHINDLIEYFGKIGNKEIDKEPDEGVIK